MLFDQTVCLAGSHLRQRLEFFSLQFIIIHKEFFQLVGHLPGKVFHFFDILENVGEFGDGQKPVIPDHFVAVLIFGLLGLDPTDDAAFDNASGEAVEFRDHYNVQRIVILAPGIRDESEVVGENHTGGEYLFQFEKGRVRHILVLLRAALRGFYHYINAMGHNRIDL
jgi:hypothetical protein